jgi:hypothetical protein
MIDAPAAGHAEMENHRVAAVGVDQPKFGTATKAGDLGACKPLPKILGEGSPEVGPARFHARDPVSLEDALKATDGRLDFGKLGHRASIWRTGRKPARAALP